MSAQATGCLVVLAKAFPPRVGGVETYSEQIVRAYLRAGLSVVVFTQTEGATGWSVRETPDGPFRLWNAGAGGQAVVFCRMLDAARRLHAQTKILGVHSTTWRVGLVGQLAFGAVPRAVTVHGREVLNHRLGVAPMMRWVLRNATTVVCVSAATRAVAIDAVRPRETAGWVTAHNGLTPARPGGASERPEQGDRLRILALCRLVPRKNIGRAVEAVAALPPGIRESIDFRIAGRGQDSAAIQHAIGAFGVGDVITMLGYVADEDVPELYDWADIFVHPHSHVGEGTDFEGFGIAIADAMAHGCAVISGRDGGPRDFVLDEVTGLLVDGNDTATISAAIERLAVDGPLRESLSARARAYALRHFSWDRHIAPTLDAFAQAGSGIE